MPIPFSQLGTSFAGVGSRTSPAGLLLQSMQNRGFNTPFTGTNFAPGNGPVGGGLTGTAPVPTAAPTAPPATQQQLLNARTFGSTPVAPPNAPTTTGPGGVPQPTNAPAPGGGFAPGNNPNTDGGLAPSNPAPGGSPAPDPSAPTPPPGIDPTQTPGPGGPDLPTSNPYDLTSLEGILASLNDPNRPPVQDPNIFAALLPHLVGASGGTMPLAFRPEDFGDTSDVNAGLKALGGPLFRATGLGPGDDALGFGLNIGLGDYISGGERGTEMDDIYRNLVGQSTNSSAADAGELIGGTAARFADESGLNDRFGKLEQTLRNDSAATLAATRQRMQDQGITGTGANAPAISAAESAQNRDLNRALLNLASLREQEGRANLGAAAQGAGASADIFQALTASPQLNLAARLGQAQNPQSARFQDALERAAQLAEGVALSNREASDAEKFLPLVGGGLSGIGGLLRGIASF